MEESYKFGYWGQTSEEILKSQFPLHRACRDGDSEALSLLLLEAQCGVYEEDNFYGWTPAHWAAYFGKLKCLMLLLDTSLSCDVSTVRLKQSPTHIAAFAGHSTCVKWLLHCGAAINQQLACLRKLVATTRIGVNSNIRTSRFRQTPGHLAAFGDHPQCLQCLLVTGSADPSTQDYLGETAVHKAARTGGMECIRLLVSHGAKLFIQNNSGQTAAQLACLCGYPECQRFLEQAAQSQETQAKGVYEGIPPTSANTTPSPTDITTSKGVNGGRLPPPGPQGDVAMSEECRMEEDTPGGSSVLSAAGDTVKDVMLEHGVSANTVPIGGRKRCREDGDEVEHKRRRSDYPMSYNGTLTNGFSNGFSQGVEWADSCNPPEPKPMYEDLDYCVGYDYNGIPQFADENEDPNPLQQARLLECEQSHQLPAKCIGLTGHYI